MPQPKEDSSEVRFTLLIPPELKEEVRVYGKRNGRVAMREAEAMLRECIATRKAKDRTSKASTR